MGSPLTTRNAEITTATVEIKTLTVSRKQVTLAVFRQVQYEDLYDYDGSMKGIPWGTVNYHPDKCAGGEEHTHVLWQKGSELRRAAVEKGQRIVRASKDQEGLAEYIQARFCMTGHNWDKFESEDEGFKRDNRRYMDDIIWFDLHGFRRFAKKPKSHYGYGCPEPEEAREEAVRLWKYFRDDTEEQQDDIVRHTGQWKEMLDLPQLFIAVLAMTEARKSPDQHLIEVQATLLRREMLTAELLRWMVIDLGGHPDHPPAIKNPRTGAEPPVFTLEDVIMDEEIVRVPAVREMLPGDFQRHLAMRHDGAKDEESHSAEHYHSGRQIDHTHKPDAWQRAQAARADIRFSHPDINPTGSTTEFLGEDNA